MYHYHTGMSRMVTEPQRSMCWQDEAEAVVTNEKFDKLFLTKLSAPKSQVINIFLFIWIKLEKTNQSAQLLNKHITIGAEGLGYDSRAGQNTTQCRQQLATAAMFRRSCVVQALSSGDRSRLSSHASMMEIWCFSTTIARHVTVDHVVTGNYMQGASIPN